MAVRPGKRVLRRVLRVLFRLLATLPAELTERLEDDGRLDPDELAELGAIVLHELAEEFGAVSSG